VEKIPDNGNSCMNFWAHGRSA